jgi:hypothetical protein
LTGSTGAIPWGYFVCDWLVPYFALAGLTRQGLILRTWQQNVCPGFLCKTGHLPAKCQKFDAQYPKRPGMATTDQLQ